MGEFQRADLSGDTLRWTGTADQRRRAGVAAASAALTAGWTREDLLDVLSALGIAETPSGGRYDPNGKHETNKDRLAATPSTERPGEPVRASATHSAPATSMATTSRWVNWKAYDTCPTCGRDTGQPCRRLRATSGDITWPHHGRKQI